MKAPTNQFKQYIVSDYIIERVYCVLNLGDQWGKCQMSLHRIGGKLHSLFKYYQFIHVFATIC